MRGGGIHLVTDQRLAFEKLCAVVDQAVAAGVRIVQLRNKVVSARELTRQACELAHVIDRRALFVINDRLDVAWAARLDGALVDGVHLGQGDVPVEAARELLGADALIGLTANSVEHFAAVTAMQSGTVDYLGVGAVHATSTKPDHPPALGIDGFARLAERAPVPVTAIGGLRPADVGPLRRAGATGVAVVSGICLADDPGLAAQQYVRAWQEAR